MNKYQIGNLFFKIMCDLTLLFGIITSCYFSYQFLITIQLFEKFVLLIIIGLNLFINFVLFYGILGGLTYD